MSHDMPSLAREVLGERALGAFEVSVWASFREDCLNFVAFRPRIGGATASPKLSDRSRRL